MAPVKWLLCLAIGLGSAVSSASSASKSSSKHHLHRRMPKRDPLTLRSANSLTARHLGLQSPSAISPYITSSKDVAIDHFNWIRSDATFSVKFLYNLTSYKPGGPILLYTGNEGTIETFYANSGFVTEYLPPLLDAAILFIEHRYFGTSQPFGSASFSKENVGFLTTEQAMADFAEVTTHFKTHVLQCLTCPVIAFGGSYGGMLSAWFRLKYPHIVDGSIAASAPILQFRGLTADDVFNRLVTDDYTQVQPACSDRIRAGFQALQRAADASEWLVIHNTFGLCTLPSASDMPALIGYLEDAYSYMAMCNYPYPTSFLNPMPGWPVTATCQGIDSIGLTEDASDELLLQALAQGTTIFYNYTGQTPCANLSGSNDGGIDADGWNYLACTEMVMPINSTGTTDFFPPQAFDLDGTFADGCFAKYGVRPRADWAVTYFGGQDITMGTNIFFSNGLQDPWRGGGVLRTLSPALPARLIEGGGHHLDLRAPNPLDPPAVVSARASELQYIRQWIHEANQRYRRRRPANVPDHGIHDWQIGDEDGPRAFI